MWSRSAWWWTVMEGKTKERAQAWSKGRRENQHCQPGDGIPATARDQPSWVLPLGRHLQQAGGHKRAGMQAGRYAGSPGRHAWWWAWGPAGLGLDMQTCWRAGGPSGSPLAPAALPRALRPGDALSQKVVAAIALR